MLPSPPVIVRRLRLPRRSVSPQHLAVLAFILLFCSLLLSVHCCGCTSCSAIQGTPSVPVPPQPDPAAASRALPAAGAHRAPQPPVASSEASKPSSLLVKIPSAVGNAPSLWVPADGALGVCFCLRSVAVAIRRVYMLPGVGGGLEMRLILAGKAGGGKSATGNTLIGERVFESKLSTKPVTVSCAKAQGHWDGEDFTVVDTADIFNPRGVSSEVHQEIIRCIRLSSPGPHALLLVTQLGRFTQEDEEAAERLQDIFGADVLGHTIVIFTRAEELVGGSLHDYVKYSRNRALHELIQRCGNRYCGFNNRAAGAERDQQVAELMGMVRCMVRVNGDRYYSNEMYLEPTLTEEKVEYHMGRYSAGRIKRVRFSCRPSLRVLLACVLIVLIIIVISLGFLIAWLR